MIDLTLAFPRLRPSDFRISSPATAQYNCIAFAAEKQDRWWWPDAMGVAYWPPESPRTETIDAFEQAYAVLGYARCDDERLERGFQKIAIFATAGMPTHAARQLPDGRWTSKLGECEDIEHDSLAALENGVYGNVALILRRSQA